MLAPLLTDVVTIKTMSTTTPDIFGDPTYTSTDVEHPALVQQQSEQEIQGDRETRITLYNVMFSPEVLVRATDRLVWGGKLMEVIGDPDVQKNSRGPVITIVKARLVTA